MRFNSSLFVLALLASTAPTLVSAGFIATCSDQAPCIEFNIAKTDNCLASGDCGITVCMILNTAKEGCSKEGNISHLCAASDGNGCAAYDSEGAPLTGKGSSGDCTSIMFDGKCEPENYGGQERVEMCQEGKPGEKLFWALKDAQTADANTYDYTGYFTFLSDSGTTCSPTIKCRGDLGYQCATPSSDMSSYTRVWEYTIPSADGGFCDLCDGPTLPPISTPPPTPPTTTNTEITGDPHFRTFKNEHFEFHGQCDLVMSSVKNFANKAIDLDIHVRTKIVRYWSYIESAAVRIGNDILEVQGSADKEDGDAKLHYWSNFEYLADLTEIGGFPVEISPRRNKYTIDLSSSFPGQKIEINTFKEFVGVKIVGATEESFGDSVGLSGNFASGKTLARDGVTEINDFNELGMEWQVLPSDGRFFHQLSAPQFPEKCFLPEDPRGERARRLSELQISEEAAEEACAGLEDEFSRKGCVYDILATQDLGMAGAY